MRKNTDQKKLRIWTIFTQIGKSLSPNLLILKLTALLALISASRCSEIKNCDNRFYAKYESKFCFHVIKTTKTSTINIPLLEFERFQDDRNIFVFQALKEYILFPKPWREKSKQTQFNCF